MDRVLQVLVYESRSKTPQLQVYIKWPFKACSIDLRKCSASFSQGNFFYPQVTADALAVMFLEAVSTIVLRPELIAHWLWISTTQASRIEKNQNTRLMDNQIVMVMDVPPATCRPANRASVRKCFRKYSASSAEIRRGVFR